MEVKTLISVVTKTTNLIEAILLTGLMVTRLSTNSVMVRDRVAKLPGQAVEACHQAQDKLSLAEERPNIAGSSLAAREKHSDKHTSLSLLPFVAISNTKVKIALLKLS